MLTLKKCRDILRVGEEFSDDEIEELQELMRALITYKLDEKSPEVSL